MRIATEAIDRLHTTATSHHRMIVCEIMGHDAGLVDPSARGIAGGADVILIPEIPYDIELVAEHLLSRRKTGKRFSILAVAEGVRSIDEVAEEVARRERARADSDADARSGKKSGKKPEEKSGTKEGQEARQGQGQGQAPQGAEILRGGCAGTEATVKAFTLFKSRLRARIARHLQPTDRCRGARDFARPRAARRRTDGRAIACWRPGSGPWPARCSPRGSMMSWLRSRGRRRCRCRSRKWPGSRSWSPSIIRGSRTARLVETSFGDRE